MSGELKRIGNEVLNAWARKQSETIDSANRSTLIDFTDNFTDSVNR